MDYSLTEEQKALQQLARDFAQKEMAPVAAEYDRTGDYPWPVVRKAHALGLTNLAIPEEYGGMGGSAIEESLVSEELYVGCSGIGLNLNGSNLAIVPIVLAGTDEQKERFLRPLAEEPIMAAFCLTEPGCGNDAANLSTSITRDGSDYVLNGTKSWVTNGAVAQQYTIFATFEPGQRNSGAFCAFVVPRDTPGISVGKKEDKMGQRASNTTEVILDNVRVPRENLLGKEGEGFKIAMKTFDKERAAAVASGAVGIARAALEFAQGYAKERYTFGKPLAAHQAIQFMLADMAIKIETARLMVRKAAWLFDEGRPCTYEASIAKCYASDISMEVATDSVQILGAYGYSKEYPVEKYMRDAKIMQIYEGSNQIQRMIIGRSLLK
jgi:acyl-CoA dehydrogenase